MPIIRSLWYKYTAYMGHNVTSSVRRSGKLTGGLDVTEHIKAMQKLATTLDTGKVGRGVLQMPIAGDITRLPFAEGLSTFERSLAREICFRSAHMPGNMAVRRTMGHAALGARVVFGETLFMTWSPNEQHSAVVLRLMRNRSNDPMLRGEGDVDHALRVCSSMQAPHVVAPGDHSEVELPLYHIRRKLVARDARAVVAAYLYEVKYKLPMLMGLRCCPFCPRCNLDTWPRPCQDIFGANTLPMGGIAGCACSMSGATEYQKKSTPHFHALLHLVNVYQYRTLADIAAAIKQKWLNPASVVHFSQWLHAEDPPDIRQYERERDYVEEAWRRRFDDGAHEALCTLPACVRRTQEAGPGATLLKKAWASTMTPWRSVRSTKQTRSSCSLEYKSISISGRRKGWCHSGHASHLAVSSNVSMASRSSCKIVGV